MGIDVFVNTAENVEELHKKLEKISKSELKLTMIGNRGARVWPEKMPDVSCGDSWRCRYMSVSKGLPITHTQIIALLQQFVDHNIDFIQTETLCNFDGKPGYTVAQDEQ